MRNPDSSRVVLRRPARYAETPARKLKTGAQKWVIQRVKNIGREV
jgi:hypothetical protein